MKVIELTDEQWASLQSGEDVVIKNKISVKKWEPEGGNFLINLSGIVSNSGNSDFPVLGTNFGMRRKTVAQAQRARDEMQIRHRLLAYRDEFDPDYVPDWSNMLEDKYFTYCDMAIKKHFVGHTKRFKNSAAVYMSEHVANKLVDKLNSGEVVL